MTASIVAWADEREKYDFASGEFDTATGHFTQLVWKDTKSVGCARKECNGDDENDAPGWFLVCEYFPGGNVIGQFRENVQEQASANAGARRGVSVSFVVMVGGLVVCLGGVW